MVALPNKYKLGAVLAAVLAILHGLLHSPLARRYPLFHWIVRLSPPQVGLIPALTPRPWGYTFEELQQTDLTGQSALITGANSGIGFEIAKALSRQGASVILACRNPQRCFVAVDEIRKDDRYSGAPLAPLMMDVSDLKSVQGGAKRFLQNNEVLDMLFLNAGIYAPAVPTSKDGIETVFATSVVGHHLLYRLLEPALQRSAMARVVSTSSVAGIMPPYASPLVPSTLEELNNQVPMFQFLRNFALYGRSKLAQVAWSKAVTRRLGEGSNVFVNSAHPGAVQTPMMTGFWTMSTVIPQSWVDFAVVHSISGLLWTASEGALTLLYLGVATDEIRRKDLRGRYFHPQSLEYDHPHAKDEELQESVWTLCEELVKNFVI